MADYEIVLLVNGPQDGQYMNWDGGNFIRFEEKGDYSPRPSASAAWKCIMDKVHTTTHLYQRDPEDRSQFLYIGVE
jgi:hypothetical protein